MTMVSLIVFVLAVMFLVGYIANIVKLVFNWEEDVFVKVIRIIGIFVPFLGAVAGLLF